MHNSCRRVFYYLFRIILSNGWMPIEAHQKYSSFRLGFLLHLKLSSAGPIIDPANATVYWQSAPLFLYRRTYIVHSLCDNYNATTNRNRRTNKTDSFNKLSFSLLDLQKVDDGDRVCVCLSFTLCPMCSRFDRNNPLPLHISYRLKSHYVHYNGVHRTYSIIEVLVRIAFVFVDFSCSTGYYLPLLFSMFSSVHHHDRMCVCVCLYCLRSLRSHGIQHTAYVRLVFDTRHSR